MKCYIARLSSVLRQLAHKKRGRGLKRIRIYLSCVRIAISQATAYRADFLLGCVITFLSNIFFPLVTILIYANGAEFPGWDMWEVLLIQSIFTMSNGVASMILSSVVWVTMDLIREGSFETVLLKPVSPLFFITASNFNIQSFGVFLGGLIVAIVAATQTGVQSVVHVLSFLLLFVAGLIVMFGTNLIMAAITFKWVGNSRIPEIFDSINNLGRYPLAIFPKALQVVATLIVPVGVIGFFPASALLGRLPKEAYFSLIPCGLYLMFGIWLYNKMIRLYEGVGG